MFWNPKRKFIFQPNKFTYLNPSNTEEDGQKISFLKSAKNVFFRAQNVLYPLISLYIHFFTSKVLLEDQKMLNLRRIKEGLLTFVLV